MLIRLFKAYVCIALTYSTAWGKPCEPVRDCKTIERVWFCYKDSSCRLIFKDKTCGLSDPTKYVEEGMKDCYHLNMDCEKWECI